MNVGSLFSGAGLLDLGLAQAGHSHGWFVEREEHRRAILERRFPGVPVHDDVRTVGAHNLGPVDCIAGGFPCKGASSAGKRTGLAHPETALWAEFERIVRELQPRWVVVENVAAILTVHGGGVWRTVLGDLAALGYDVVWDCLPAAVVGAPHGRDRVFAFARHADGAGLEGHGRHDERPDERIAGTPGSRTEDAADAERLGRAARPGLRAGAEGRGPRAERPGRPDDDGVQAVEWGEYEPAVRRWEVVHGPAPEPLVRRLDARGADMSSVQKGLERSRMRAQRQRLSALGDGVQVQVARLVGEALAMIEEQ